MAGTMAAQCGVMAACSPGLSGQTSPTAAALWRPTSSPIPVQPLTLLVWLQLYESTRFTDAGFRHHELYFPDGSCPPDHILQQFLAISEQDPGGLVCRLQQHLSKHGLGSGPHGIGKL